jgi:hypothetical protein
MSKINEFVSKISKRALHFIGSTVETRLLEATGQLHSTCTIAQPSFLLMRFAPSKQFTGPIVMSIQPRTMCARLLGLFTPGWCQRLVTWTTILAYWLSSTEWVLTVMTAYWLSSTGCVLTVIHSRVSDWLHGPPYSQAVIN